MKISTTSRPSNWMEKFIKKQAQLEDLENNSKVSNSLTDTWKKRLKKFPEQYVHMPDDLKNNPEMFKDSIRAFINTTFIYDYMPAQLKNYPEVREILINKWVEKLQITPFQYQYIPEEIKNEPAIQQSLINGWTTTLKKDPSQYKLIPEELKSDPRIRAYV